MEVLCLFISHLPVQWAVQQDATRGLGVSPNSSLIIGGFPHERKTVLDCSGKAAASGVHPGMTLRQASHRWPEAVFLPVDEAGYAQAFEEMLD